MNIVCFNFRNSLISCINKMRLYNKWKTWICYKTTFLIILSLSNDIVFNRQLTSTTDDLFFLQHLNETNPQIQRLAFSEDLFAFSNSLNLKSFWILLAFASSEQSNINKIKTIDNWEIVTRSIFINLYCFRIVRGISIKVRVDLKRVFEKPSFIVFASLAKQVFCFMTKMEGI